MKRQAQKAAPFLLAALLAGVMAWYSDVYVNWRPDLFPFAVAASALVFLALAASVVWPGEGRPGKKLLRALGWAAAFVAAEQVPSVLINSVAFHGGKPGAALLASLPLLALLTGLLLARPWRALTPGGKRAVWIPPAALLCALGCAWAAATCAPPAWLAQSASVMKLAGDGAIQATPREYVFDNDRLLLGAYCYDTAFSDAESLGRVKAAGLDFLICGVTPAFLEECARQGVGVIAAGYHGPGSWLDMGDGVEDAWLGLKAEDYKQHAALWGDDVFDEPRAREFGKIGGILAHYYSLGAGRMPLVNLNPAKNADRAANATGLRARVGWRKYLLPGTLYSDAALDIYRQYAAAYIKTIDADYISLDIYPYYKTARGRDYTLSTWLHNLDILAEACRGTGRGLWVVTQAAGEAKAEDTSRYCDRKCDQLQQAYASLAFGAKAIVYACYQAGWWDSASHLVTDGGEPTDTYYAVQAVNEELRGFAEVYGGYEWLGAYTVNRRKVAGTLYGLANGLPKSERPRLDSKDGLLVGCFDKKGGGGKAYIIANMMELGNEKTAACTVEFPAGETVTVYGGGEVKTYEGGGRVELALGPGDGRFVTVG
ncbi:MAG: hypothetical protein LBB75_05340 [Oscillospiraceae bacterium]|jgi:hypothetical protein|nr:hypothetical protein [Oscillospiraceae bacterium]